MPKLTSDFKAKIVSDYYKHPVYKDVAKLHQIDERTVKHCVYESRDNTQHQIDHDAEEEFLIELGLTRKELGLIYNAYLNDMNEVEVIAMYHISPKLVIREYERIRETRKSDFRTFQRKLVDRYLTSGSIQLEHYRARFREGKLLNIDEILSLVDQILSETRHTYNEKLFTSGVFPVGFARLASPYCHLAYGCVNVFTREGTEIFIQSIEKPCLRCAQNIGIHSSGNQLPLFQMP